MEGLSQSNTGAICLTSKYMFVAVGRGQVAKYLLEEHADRTKRVGQYTVAPYHEESKPREPVDVIQVAAVGKFVVVKLRASGEYPYPVLVAVDTSSSDNGSSKPRGYILEEPVDGN